MALNPNFTSTPRVGVGTVSTANTARDGTGTIVDILTGVAAGTKIFEVWYKSTGDLADCVLTLFLHDGTTYQLFDEVDLGDQAAGSTTVTAFRGSKTFDNLVLPSASWKLAAAITVAPTSGVLKVFAFAGDLT